jgi:hypothetical protein
MIDRVLEPNLAATGFILLTLAAIGPPSQDGSVFSGRHAERTSISPKSTRAREGDREIL